MVHKMTEDYDAVDWALHYFVRMMAVVCGAALLGWAFRLF